jgi:serine phosphatase RsbU (regulator of sigma subunit)
MFDPCIQSAKEADSEFFAAMDGQRATILRKRISWYAVAAMILLGLGVIGNVLEIVSHGPVDNSTSAAIQIVSNMVLIGLNGAALAFVLKVRPNRSRLVNMLTLLLVLALLIGMPFEIIADWAKVDSWAGGGTGESARLGSMQRSVNAFGLFYCMACILVPMRLMESGRIALLGVPIFGAVLVLMARLTFRESLLVTGMFAGYAAIGMLWSGWRYRVFDFHFRAENLREKYDDLSGEVKEFSAELTHARRLHEALFPDEIKSGPVRVAYRYEPMREIGGDFLFINREAGGGATIVLIDVSGHGIPAALSVNRLHGELQRFFSHYPAPTGESGRPGHLLTDLNTYARAALAPQGVYATVLVLRVEPATDVAGGGVEWASAGHPAAFLRRRGGEARELGSTAIMLGVLETDEFDSAARRVELGVGDVILAYTDGAAEARDAHGNDFSAKRIREAMEAGASKPSFGVRGGAIAGAVLEQVAAHRRGRVSDDTLVVEIVMAGRTTPLSEFMAAPRKSTGA